MVRRRGGGDATSSLEVTPAEVTPEIPAEEPRTDSAVTAPVPAEEPREPAAIAAPMPEEEPREPAAIAAPELAEEPRVISAISSAALRMSADLADDIIKQLDELAKDIANCPAGPTGPQQGGGADPKERLAIIGEALRKNRDKILQPDLERIQASVTKVVMASEASGAETRIVAATRESINALAMYVKSLFADIKKPHIFVSASAIAAIILILAGLITSVVFVIKIVLTTADNALIKNPINRESLDYNVARSTNFLKAKYPYVIFLIIPWLILIAAALGFIYMVKTRASAPVPGFIVGILCIAVVYSIFTLVMNYIAFFYGNRMLSIVSSRIRGYNGFIWTRLYKRADFLKYFNEVQSNQFMVMDTVKQAFASLPDNLDTDALARAMFTANLYLHYQKLGMRNPNITGALDTLNIVRLLTPMAYTPSDYLFRKSTYIEDYSENLIISLRTAEAQSAAQAIASGKPKTARKPYSEAAVNEAAIQVAEWMATANNRANGFYAEDALAPFIKMAFIITAANVLPFAGLVWLFRKPAAREALIAMIQSYAPRA